MEGGKRDRQAREIRKKHEGMTGGREGGREGGKEGGRERDV